MSDPQPGADKLPTTPISDFVEKSVHKMLIETLAAERRVKINAGDNEGAKKVRTALLSALCSALLSALAC